MIAVVMGTIFGAVWLHVQNVDVVKPLLGETFDALRLMTGDLVATGVWFGLPQCAVAVLTYALITPRLFAKAPDDEAESRNGGDVRRSLSGIGRIALLLFCALPLLATAMAWVRSYYADDHIGYRRANNAWAVVSSKGSVFVGAMDEWMNGVYPRGVSFNAAGRGLTPRIARDAEQGSMRIEWWFAGARPARVYTCPATYQIHYATLTFVAGLAPCCVAFCLLYSARLLVAALSRRRGLCVRCRYDLTGNTTGVCPECGLIAATGWDVRELIWPGKTED